MHITVRSRVCQPKRTPISVRPEPVQPRPKWITRRRPYAIQQHCKPSAASRFMPQVRVQVTVPSAADIQPHDHIGHGQIPTQVVALGALANRLRVHVTRTVGVGYRGVDAGEAVSVKRRLR